MIQITNMEEILKTLSKDELSLTITKSFSKGETVFYEGQKCESICIVEKGLVRIISYSSSKEITYNTLVSGDMFGNNLLFSTEPFYKGNVIVDVNAKITFISKQNFLSICQSNNNFLKLFLKYESDLTKKLNFKIKLLSISDAKERLIFYLISNNRKITIKSITSLANELGLTRETVSRLVNGLNDKNLFIKNKKTLYLK